MTVYSDFLGRLTFFINDSTADVNVLAPTATEYAVRSLERKFKFNYMRRVEYHKIKGSVTTPTVVQTLGHRVGDTIENLVLGDGVISWYRSTPAPNPLPLEGEYLKFIGPFMPPGWGALSGKSGRVRTVTPDPILHGYTFEVEIDIEAGLPQETVPFLGEDFDVEHYATDPDIESNFDPGVVPFGRRTFEIECLDVCDPDDYKMVLKKNLEVFDPKLISAPLDSWDASVEGTVPSNYVLLGAAELQAAEMLGSLIVDNDEDILLLRPKPDEKYWLRAIVWRYSEWPQDDHWLLGPAQDVLLYQTMIELGPALRDKDLMAMAGTMLAQKLNDLGISNSYHRASGDTRRMEYNAYRDDNL